MIGVTCAGPDNPTRGIHRRPTRHRESVALPWHPYRPRHGRRSLELPKRTDRFARVLVVAESFLPQVNGVTNSVRRVLEHLEAERSRGRAGRADRAGDVRRVPGHPRPWREPAVLPGLPDRARDPSPAALGDDALPARRRAPRLAGDPRLTRRPRPPRELGIPTVAIYQTDLVGFAERYDIPGGVRAMAALTRKIHTRGRPHPGAVVGQPPPARSSSEIPAHRLWPRGVDLEAFHPGHRSDQLRRELAPDGRLLVGYVGRLAPEKELELLAHLAADPRYALVMVGGGPEEQRLRTLLPGARFLGVLHGDGARPGLRLARRLRAHRPARDLLPVRPGGAGVRRAGRRAAGGWAARRRRRRGDRAPLRSRVTAPTSRRTSAGWPPTGCSGAGWGWPRGAASSGTARGTRSTTS